MSYAQYHNVPNKSNVDTWINIFIGIFAILCALSLWIFYRYVNNPDVRCNNQPLKVTRVNDCNNSGRDARCAVLFDTGDVGSVPPNLASGTLYRCQYYRDNSPTEFFEYRRQP